MKRILLVEKAEGIIGLFERYLDERALLMPAQSIEEAKTLISSSWEVRAIFFSGTVYGGSTTASGIIPLAREKFPTATLVAMSSFYDVNELQMKQGCDISLSKMLIPTKLPSLLDQICETELSVA